MKQLETHSVTVGNTAFYIRPFSAFKASNIFGKISAVLLPIISALLPLAIGMVGEDANGLDTDLSSLAPSLSGALSGFSGDQVEELLKELLIKNKNVSYDDEESGKTVILTEDAANELFCGDTQDMFTLALEVIKLNYSGFFKKLSGLSGTAIAEARKKGTLGILNTAN